MWSDVTLMINGTILENVFSFPSLSHKQITAASYSEHKLIHTIKSKCPLQKVFGDRLCKWKPFLWRYSMSSMWIWEVEAKPKDDSLTNNAYKRKTNMNSIYSNS